MIEGRHVTVAARDHICDVDVRGCARSTVRHHQGEGDRVAHVRGVIVHLLVQRDVHHRVRCHGLRVVVVLGRAVIARRAVAVRLVVIHDLGVVVVCARGEDSGLIGQVHSRPAPQGIDRPGQSCRCRVRVVVRVTARDRGCHVTVAARDHICDVDVRGCARSTVRHHQGEGDCVAHVRGVIVHLLVQRDVHHRVRCHGLRVVVVLGRAVIARRAVAVRLVVIHDLGVVVVCARGEDSGLIGQVHRGPAPQGIDRPGQSCRCRVRVVVRVTARDRGCHVTVAARDHICDVDVRGCARSTVRHHQGEGDRVAHVRGVIVHLLVQRDVHHRVLCHGLRVVVVLGRAVVARRAVAVRLDVIHDLGAVVACARWR